MFRRRFRNVRNMPVDPALLPLLNQANQLMAAGQPAQAAPLFTRLAELMESRNRPRLAANLYAQAAHACADAKDEPLALAQARSALRLFIRLQMVERTPRFYANITRKLRANGMKAAADAIQKEFGTWERPDLPAVAPEQHGRLPLACPQCGAPVRSDEITWVDKRTAECAYCGALLPAG